MRKDPRPLWLKRLADARTRAYARHFLAPQFDALGAGLNAVAPRSVEITGRGITAGRHLHILSARDAPVRLTTWPGPDEEARIELGDYVLLTGGVRLLAARSITIGDAAMLAHGVTISDCDWHGVYDRVTATATPKPVTLARNVWVADGAFIGKGVTIGENAVIGARAVVTRDVAANTVVAGNPARVIAELDPNAARRDRADLFADYEMAEAYMEEAWRKLHPDNSLLGWLRARLFPNNRD